MTTDRISRRTLTGVAAAGVGVPLLAACSDDDSGSTATDATPTSDAPSSTSSSAAPTESPASEAPASEEPAGDALAATGDIEVGGGTIFADEEVVITQPTEGEFKGFSAVCTHQGCIVASVSDGTINCECHGSKFSIETGEPEDGPASSPLEEVTVTVSGDSITLG